MPVHTIYILDIAYNAYAEALEGLWQNEELLLLEWAWLAR
ncbi:Uncharacterised protein [Zhongshania aliphaticivorans]|uniref:Uncharacterized protein n=1 Tax=Zhongshania aliphaticivorans TaxID=1470434 RepID=A0A5S9NI18_9GAMM|nr:Uncharacterised protein [Zhongshania aliphaticivorans]CAA0096114.1 Uncharacterised protein [Zhongshania aliphaticivorans]